MRLIGSGNEADIYSDGRGNAIKIINLNLLRKEEVENYVNNLNKAKLLNNRIAKLGHSPHIHFQYRTQSNYFVIVMEELKGFYPVGTVLPHPITQLNILKKIFLEEKIQHNDSLNYKNILYNPVSGEVKIIDFTYAEEKDVVDNFDILEILIDLDPDEILLVDNSLIC